LRTRRFEDAVGTAAAATTAAHSAAGGSVGSNSCSIGTVPTDDAHDPLLARTDSDAALVGGGRMLRLQHLLVLMLIRLWLQMVIVQ
jgi:hypothetical protein